MLVEVYPDVTEGFEMAVAFLPPGIAALAPPARARLVLEVVHAAAMRLGGARGWDTVVCASPVAAVWGSSRSFADHAQTVRWRSKTLVQFQPDDGVSIGTTGTDRSPVIVDLADPASFGDAR